MGFYTFCPFYTLKFTFLLSVFKVRLKVAGHIGMTSSKLIRSFSGELGHLEIGKFQNFDILTKNNNFVLCISAQHLPLKLGHKLKIMDKFRRTDPLSPFLRKLWPFFEFFRKWPPFFDFTLLGHLGHNIPYRWFLMVKGPSMPKFGIIRQLLVKICPF